MFTLHHYTRRWSCSGQPTTKGRRRSRVDPTVKCRRVKPFKSGVEPRRRTSAYYSLTLATSAANPVPNVLLCIPLDFTGKAERRVLTTGHPRISIHLAQACALERSFQCRCPSDRTNTGDPQHRGPSKGRNSHYVRPANQETPTLARPCHPHARWQVTQRHSLGELATGSRPTGKPTL